MDLAPLVGNLTECIDRVAGSAKRPNLEVECRELVGVLSATCPEEADESPVEFCANSSTPFSSDLLGFISQATVATLDVEPEVQSVVCPGMHHVRQHEDFPGLQGHLVDLADGLGDHARQDVEKLLCHAELRVILLGGCLVQEHEQSRHPVGIPVDLDDWHYDLTEVGACRDTLADRDPISRMRIQYNKSSIKSMVKGDSV